MNSSNKSYDLFNTYCLRAPLLPYTTLHRLWSKPITPAILRTYFEDPVIKTAIFIASQTVYEALEKWYLHHPLKENSGLSRIENTFLKYLIRASSRPTPFGMFSGVALGAFGEHSKVILNGFNPKVRLDMNYLSGLTSHIEKHPAVLKQLKFKPNSSLFQISNQHRYVKQRIIDAEKTYSVEAVETTPYIEKVIACARSGKNIDALCRELLAEDISYAEAYQFIIQLFEMQLLVSDLEISITGNDQFQNISKFVLKTSEISSKENYSKISTLLESLSQKPPSSHIAIYKEIMEQIKTLDATYNPKFLFQVDLFLKTEKNILDKSIKHEILELLPILNSLTKSRPSKNLDSFVKSFRERYDDQEISLLLALDVESGIPYPHHVNASNTTPFLNDLTSIYSAKKTTSETTIYTSLDKLLLSRLINCTTEGSYFLDVEELSLDSETISWDDLPDTISGIVDVVYSENKRFISVNSFGGSSGANLIARFCENDEQLLKHASTIVAAEEAMNPSKILAEIVHLPEARVGNILKHPAFRKFEIPYLSKTNPGKNTILLSDIMISLRNDTIVLRSKTHNAHIYPRLTNAHNFSSKSLPVYHFLCDLQLQGKRGGLSFSWPSQANEFPFLPRVIFKNCVISKAQWKVTKQEILSFLELSHNKKQLLKRIKDWREEKKIPQLAYIKDYDNKLLINFNQISMALMFIEIGKKTEKLILEEFLGDKTTTEGNGSYYANEFVVTAYNTKKLKMAVHG